MILSGQLVSLLIVGEVERWNALSLPFFCFFLLSSQTCFFWSPCFLFFPFHFDTCSRNQCHNFDAKFRSQFFVPIHDFQRRRLPSRPKGSQRRWKSCIGMKNWLQNLASNLGLWRRFLDLISGACVRRLRDYSTPVWSGTKLQLPTVLLHCVR